MLFIFSHDFSRLLRGARSVPLHYCSATVIISLFRVPAFALYCSQHWWGCGFTGSTLPPGPACAGLWHGILRHSQTRQC